MATRNLTVVVAGDVKGLGRATRAAEKDVNRLDRRISGFASTSSRGFSRVGVAARGMAALGGGAAALLAKSFVTSASDIEESLTKNEQLFGKQAATIDRWSKTTATAMGISRKEALESVGAFGSVFETIGLADRPAADMSRRFTTLAADLASFNNSTPTEALDALRSGLIGEAEPMRRFGALLSETRVKQEAYRSGIAKTGSELTEQQKVQARYNLILRDTQAAQGDFARTSGGVANQTRILRARITDLGASVGRALLPAVLRGVTVLNRFVRQMQDGTGTGGQFVNVMRRVGGALGAVAGAVRSVVGWFQRHRTATTVLLTSVAGLTAGIVAYRTVVTVATARTRALAAAQGLLNIAMRLNPIGLVITAVAALGAGLVVAYKRSATFRNIVDGAFRVVRSGAEAVGRAVNRNIIQPFLAVVRAGRRIVGVFRDIAGAVPKVPDLNPFGDGVGKALAGGIGPGSIPGGGLSAGGLKGAKAGMTPFAAVGARFGLSVSSGLRPGAVTSSGNPSWHGSGEAVDLAGSPAGMMRTFQYLKRTAGSRLAELIYTPGGALSNGRPYTPTGKLAADHFDHVHVAMDLGKPGQGDGIGEAASAGRAAGWRGQDLITAVAVAGPESNYRNAARLVTGREDSRSMWQINTLAHTWARNLNLKNPFVAARAAYRVWQQAGRSFSPWTGYTSGNYRAFIDRARAAVVGSRGKSTGTSKGSSGASGGMGTTVEKVSPYDQSIAGADVAIAEAEGRALGEAIPGSPDALQQATAVTAKRKVVGARISKVRAALKKKSLRPATRLRLTQELGQLLGEHAQLGQTGRELRTPVPPEAGDTGADTSAADDAAREAQERLQQAIEENTRAQQEHASALQGVKDELKRQTDFATAVQTTETSQLKKALADYVSGYIGGYGVVPRSYTPGSGVAFQY